MLKRTRWSAVSGTWNALFRDHEIYVRTGGDVRFLRLSAALQRRMAAIGIVVIATWLLATVGLIGWQAYASVRGAEVTDRAVAVERAEAQVAAERRSIDSLVDDLDARADYLDAAVTAHFPHAGGAVHDEPADADLPAGAGIESRPAATRPAAARQDNPVDRLRAIDARQRHTVAALTHGAAGRIERAMAALRLVGIRAPNRRAGMGGPFVADERIRVPVPRDPAMRRLAETFDRMDLLEAMVVALPSNLPAERMTLSSGFGYRRDPFTGGGAMHAGLDFTGAHGSAIMAAAAGRVIFAGQQNGYGNVVEIDHGHGMITRYAHLSGFDTYVGARVAPGQRIARMGSTGRSTGTHLHFEVRVGGTAVNPRRFLEANAHVLEIQADAGPRTRVAAR